MTQDLYFFDTETFAHDNLFAFVRQRDGETYTFWNDPEGVQDFVNLMRPVLCGYNARDYDSYILKGALLGWSPEDIKVVNDTIIEQDDRTLVWGLFTGHPFVNLPPIIDLWHDIVPRMGLKNIEANIGMPIVESSVPFDISRPLTPDERAEVQRYCLHDIEATAALYGLRYDYLKSKSDLCELRGIDPLTMLKHTNARIVSEVLEAQRMTAHPHETYEIPDNIDQTAIPESVIAYVGNINTDNCMDKDAPKVEFMFHGCPTTFALGGIHAAVPSYVETASEDRAILIQDIGSFYPSLIINNGYMSRAVADPSLYHDFYDLRMKAKADGDKATADAAKLVLNTTYGTFKDTYNKLFDPMQGTRVCLSGQLYIIDLIEQMFRTVSNLQLIQLNTDGWVVSCNRVDIDRVHDAVLAWQKRTGFTVDTDEVQKIVQANVNNYVMRTVDGKVKAKGGVVARFAGGDFKSNSATIIDKAVVDYLLDGVSIEDTILSCDDMMRFQIIAKAGRTFQKVVWEETKDCRGTVEAEVQRVNRVYATKFKGCGGIFKVKMEDGKEVGRSKIPLTPDHCFIDNENSHEKDLTTLDKGWYIALAKKKAHEFITRDKKEKEQMATETETHNEAEDAKPTPTRKAKPKDSAQVPEPVIKPFKERLLALQGDMAKAATGVKFDSVVSNINYEYADTQQYKAWLSALCSNHGIIFKLNMTSTFLGVITPEGKGTPSYGAQADGNVTLVDAYGDNDEYYDISGFASNVQSGYCNGAAQTNALRNFILNNFLLDNKGREGDDQAFNAATDSSAKGYTPPAEKAAIKQGIADGKAEEAKYATDMFASALYDKIIEAQAVKPKFGAKMLSEHYEDGKPKVVNGKSTMLKADAVAGLNKAEEIISGAAE
jgi:hypothetical protein